MSEAIEGPCDCPGPHFHSVVHACCDQPEYVSDSIAVRMTGMAAEILDLRFKLTSVEAACERYGSCINGYDPGESCGCLLCEVRAALSAGSTPPATPAEVCHGCGGKGWIYTDHGDCGGCSGYPGILHEPTCGTEPCGHPIHSGEGDQ